ncbi:MAG: phospho-N-acetylmuramoyl-pentapeptide-transferase [Thermaerobacter sp.]|nr:phospho-N-acetylmuramoyl-pentapeptide-transferase [Thermaerobacter sp.]
MAGGVVGFLLSLGFGPILIPWLARLKFGQMVREAGPASHRQKQGTPTMGGVLFLLPLPLVVAILDVRDVMAWALVLLVIGFGLIGLADDLAKVVNKRPLGLRAREKLLMQLLVASAFAWEMSHIGRFGQIALPFRLGSVPSGVWYGPLAVLAIVGSANAVNITDGLDGLAAGATAISTTFFVFFGLVRHMTGLALVAISLVGALVGFLPFNLHPARVFMGDTGSLALGAGLAGLAIASGTTLVLPVLGILFVAETVSVIIQVVSFRITGRRVFRMSPLHHHFELGGWSEERVVAVFWLVSLAGAVLAWL